MKEVQKRRERMESRRGFFYLRPCWLHPPPEVYTRAWNGYHSPGSHLRNRHRRGFLQAPPGDVLHPHPCWASSGEPLETEPGVEQRHGERSRAPRPRGWGCTRSLLRHPHHSPLQGPGWTGRCSPKTTAKQKLTTSNVQKNKF